MAPNTQSDGVQSPTTQASPPAYADPYADDDGMRKHYASSGYYGIMYAGDYEWDTRRCIEEAYGDTPATPRSTTVEGQPRRSLKFHTEWLTLEEARALLPTVPEYNCFHPQAVDDVLADVPQSTRVSIAREGSVALYFWTDNAQTVMSALRSINADGDYGHGTFAPGPPDELGFQAEVDTYPSVCVGTPPEDVSNGQDGVIRAWWD